RGDAALVVEVLVATERRVLHEGPALAAKPVRLALRRIADGLAVWARLRVAAVVGHEKDERVVQHAALLQARDEIAHGLVHEMHHSGIDGHDVVETILLVGRHVRRPRRLVPRWIDDPEFLLPRVTRIADRAPARLVFAAELRDVLRWRLQR